MADTARPDPDALLAQLRADDTRAERGRLRIYFGPGYGLSIESAPYAGTTVTIRTPRVPEDREGEYDKTH